MRLSAVLILILTMTAPAALACALPAGAESLRKEAAALINAQRRAEGLPALTSDPRLMQAAQSHACDNAGRRTMSHQGGDGSTLKDRLRRAGYAYRAANENVAMGQRNAETVVASWMASSGHRRNILQRGTREMGIAVALAPDGRPHWVFLSGQSR
ncbi:MAG TPA: CAP domain-containing protein [Paracoccaceae bacterium]|nr:CAP domain-containing protein [Paracoccaceae bacterium]